MLRSALRPVARSVIAASPASSSASACAAKRSFSWWGHVELGPKDPILGVTEKFLADPSPNKINLGVGAYRDDNNKPVVLKSVQEAITRLYNQNLHNEYAPIGGDSAFVKHAVDLAFENAAPIKEGRYAAVQALSGTGALRLAGEFINRFKPMAVYLPNPTWGNHIPIFKDSGLEVRQYKYYDAKTKGLDLKGMLADIAAAPKGSCFLLHACAHNPTGVDPNPEQWKEISAAIKKGGHFVVMDSAYQGFASGDPSRDALAVQIFVKDGHQFALCQSFAKNFGLYGHRVGCLTLLLDSAEEAPKVESQLKILARPIYSSPPIQGARIITTVMADPALKKQWYIDVKEMAERIILMRQMLVKDLKAAGSKHNWQHVLDQIGMFCYSGMTPEQVDKLMTQHHIYLTSNGRISMVGLTTKNVGTLAKAMHEVTK